MNLEVLFLHKVLLISVQKGQHKVSVPEQF